MEDTSKNAIPRDEDGSELWLRYRLEEDPALLASYRAAIGCLRVEGWRTSATLAALRDELRMGLSAILGDPLPCPEDPLPSGTPPAPGTVLAGTPSSSPTIAGLGLDRDLAALGEEGFILKRTEIGGSSTILIASQGQAGALYGAFALLRLLQSGSPLGGLDIKERPRIALRMIDHWETTRCYAGGNVWDWDALPDRVHLKYLTYARAHASIGVNAMVLNNVNAERKYLTKEYIAKEKALADLFRPYGIRVFLSANFSAPVSLGGLPSADPADLAALDWWKAKCAEIYAAIPDFGGFVVKANSEGEPGPKDYGRNHAEGANLLARAIEGFGGLVIWRAFVYDPDVDPDRLKRSYKEFVPLDGSFLPNVVVQAKNGPLDFQPREPFNPLFGRLPRTPLAMEFQISQEYLGQDRHLVYLAPMWKEVLDADTFALGPGSSVARIVDGSLYGREERSVIAAVANTGDDPNWCGHHFHQANLYAYGRLAWDHSLDAAGIAQEWIKLTWCKDKAFIGPVLSMILGSRETCVDYMTPLGLGHIMARDHHMGPQPDDTVPGHEDWSPTYYHRADSSGLGYDRSSRGSGFSAQYHPPVAAVFDDIDACPEELLCWFHHVPWKRTMKSGRCFWDELAFRYRRGVEGVDRMLETWRSLRAFVDGRRFREVEAKLVQQARDAREWHDVCLSYFSRFSRMPFTDSSGIRQMPA
jgi:alpha-glucuronidase